MELRDYATCDATELRRLLSAREVTAAEVRDAALRAIEAVDPQLNATVSGPYEDAEGDVPFAAKDTLPLGVMLTAQTLREDMLLHVAAQLETALPWAARTPAVDAAS